MSTLPELLDQFHTAILTSDVEPVVALLKENPRLTPKRQLAIYIEGYRLRLVQAIRSDYPALLALLGNKLFDQLALAYIEIYPPTGYNLDRYPHSFAAFIRAHHNDEFAADLAELEGNIAEVFMMEESNPLDPSALAGLTPEEFSGLTLGLRCASKLLAFSYPVDNWLITQREGNILPRPAKETSFVYMYRHNNSVQRVPLIEVAYHLLAQLGQGLPVGQVLDATANAYPEHAETIIANLQAWFTEWINEGFFRQ